MMSITLLVLFLFLRYYQQKGGAVSIESYGSGIFVRVHFKDNTATVVRDLLFLSQCHTRIVDSKTSFFFSFSFMEIFFDIYSVEQPLCFFVCSP